MTVVRTRARLILLVMIAAVALMTVGAYAQGGPLAGSSSLTEAATLCRTCMQACPSSDFCWCNRNWCSDVCEIAPECQDVIVE